MFSFLNLQNGEWLRFKIQTRQIAKCLSAKEANFPNPICTNKSFYHTSQLIRVMPEAVGREKMYSFLDLQNEERLKFQIQRRQIAKSQSAKEANFPNPICTNKSFFHTRKKMSRNQTWDSNHHFLPVFS